MVEISAKDEPADTRRFLLSASVPTDDDRGRRFGPFSSRDVTAAASAVAREVLHRGDVLVFGGHPSITPMVLLAAAELGVRDQVVIYQSGYFSEEITSEVYRLVADDYGRMITVDAVGGPDPRSARTASLARMRSRMLSEPLAGAFFIGGMEGIADESMEFRERHPSQPAFFFATPGGNAAKIAAHAKHRIDGHSELLAPEAVFGPGDYSVEGRAYLAIAAQLVAGV